MVWNIHPSRCHGSAPAGTVRRSIAAARMDSDVGGGATLTPASIFATWRDCPKATWATCSASWGTSPIVQAQPWHNVPCVKGVNKIGIRTSNPAGTILVVMRGTYSFPSPTQSHLLLTHGGWQPNWCFPNSAREPSKINILCLLSA
jgi:hypothetical protein